MVTAVEYRSPAPGNFLAQRVSAFGFAGSLSVAGTQAACCGRVCRDAVTLMINLGAAEPEV